MKWDTVSVSVCYVWLTMFSVMPLQWSIVKCSCN
jgi:hypothetical protein